MKKVYAVPEIEIISLEEEENLVVTSGDPTSGDIIVEGNLGGEPEDEWQ